jgi:hypothetical protein
MTDEQLKKLIEAFHPQKTTWEKIAEGLNKFGYVVTFFVGFWLWNQVTVSERKITQTEQRLNERLDMQDAKTLLALKTTIEKLEQGYKELQKKERLISAHCQQEKCALPVSLISELPPLNYKPVEQILLEREKVQK